MGMLSKIPSDVVKYIDPWDVQAWANEIFKMTNDNNFFCVNLEKRKYEIIVKKK